MSKQDYRCPECGAVEEKDTLHESPVCYDCFVMMEWLPTSAPALAFKGAGWTPKGPGRRI